MEFREVVRRRRMVRSFERRPVPAAVVDRVLDAGRRAPSAGHSQGFAFVVLEGAAQTERYWDTMLPVERRHDFAWPSLLHAPVLVVALSSAQAYVERYGEPDKAGTGLSRSPSEWVVPYWTVDTSFAAMSMLLAAVDEGLGALFFGIFEGRDRLLAALGVPPGWEPVGTIALGWAAPSDGPSGSAVTRPRRSLDDVVHRGGW